jgi:transcriptional regulator with XRE-family HTH domain
VDRRDDIKQFLISRRNRLTPDQAGLRTYGERRRVSGLRRSEVAELAGISVEYYTRLERGDARHVSADVLDAVARALHLDELEREHLIDLFRAAAPTGRPRRRRQPKTRESIQLVLDAMTGAAAFLRNARLDLLIANRLGLALYDRAFADPKPNLARYVFLDPHSQDFYGDWDGIATDAVGSLRAEAARDPQEPALIELVGEMSTRSEEFRARWAAHPVRRYRSGTQPFHHPVAGDLELAYEALDLVTDPGLTIVAYTAAPGSQSRQGLDLLASWTAPTHEASPAHQAEDRA